MQNKLSSSEELAREDTFDKQAPEENILLERAKKGEKGNSNEETKKRYMRRSTELEYPIKQGRVSLFFGRIRRGNSLKGTA